MHSLANDNPFDLRRALDGKVTLLTVSVRESGFAVLPRWEEPFEDTFGLEGGVGETAGAGSGNWHAGKDGLAAQSLRLMINDYTVLRWLSFAVVPSMRASVPEERRRRERSFYFFGGIPELLNERVLGSVNPLVGYALLIDGNRRIRWRACGEPGGGKGETVAPGGATEELESMLQTATLLQKERVV